MNIPKIALTVWVASLSVFAGGKSIIPVDTPVVPVLDGSFYVGLGTGKMTLDNSFTLERLTTNTSISLQMGYTLLPYVAIEGRYSKNIGSVAYDKGKTSNKNNSNFPMTFSNVALYVKGMYPLVNFKPYVLLGYGRITLTNIAGADRSQNGLQWGVGAAYDVTDHIEVFADYTKLYDRKGFGGRSKNRRIKINAFTVGVNYVF